jgi:hypothetical protein
MHPGLAVAAERHALLMTGLRWSMTQSRTVPASETDLQIWLAAG